MTAPPPATPPPGIPPDPGRHARMARTLARVAADFRRELPGRLAQAQALRDTFQEASSEPARAQALEALLLLLHAMAGTAGTLGLDAVGDAARRGEHAAQALRQQPDGSADGEAALARCIEDLGVRIREALTATP